MADESFRILYTTLQPSSIGIIAPLRCLLMVEQRNKINLEASRGSFCGWSEVLPLLAWIFLKYGQFWSREGGLDAF